MSVGKRMRLPAASASLNSRAQLSTCFLQQRPARVVALGRQEGEAHATAHQEGVDLVQQGLDHPELVGDLGPPEDGDERPLGRLQETVEDLHFSGQHPPGGGRQELRWADDGGCAR